MKHYVADSEIIFSDEVRVQSHNIRNQYIRGLTNFAGNDSRIHWEEKNICLYCTYTLLKIYDNVKPNIVKGFYCISKKLF